MGTIEFALIAMFLATLLLGTLDFGIGFWEQMQVGNAARAGADYAAKTYTANGFNSTNIANAVTNATGLASITATPAPTSGCACPNATSGITTATCGSACAAGGTAGTYVNVSAQASYTTLISWPGISNPIVLTASTVIRVE